MGHGIPFHRARAMMAAIGALFAQGMVGAQVEMQLGAYKSRGKGRGTPSRNFMRGAGRSTYEPHQGKQEIARRFERMNHGLPR